MSFRQIELTNPDDFVSMVWFPDRLMARSDVYTSLEGRCPNCGLLIKANLETGVKCPNCGTPTTLYRQIPIPRAPGPHRKDWRGPGDLETTGNEHTTPAANAAPDNTGGCHADPIS